MSNFTVILTAAAFLLTLAFLFWRPGGVNEAIPATIGAGLVLIAGSVTFADLGSIAATVGGAAVTILATMVMANVLESFGFFQWTADWLSARARGSGIRLFWLVNLLCFLMTLFFNNDGSILITTPILLLLLRRLGLKPHQQIPYLLSGALVATASSAPIGVSNIVNLIALDIVGMSLYMHTAMMFVPAALGLLALVLLLFVYFYPRLPKSLSELPSRPGRRPFSPRHHPLIAPLPAPPPSWLPDSGTARNTFMGKIFLFVFGVRIALFAASYFGLSIPLTAVLGSVILLFWRWHVLRISPADMIRKTPWSILVFAFSMYVLIYGLHAIGLTDWIAAQLQPLVTGSLLDASLIMGGLLSVLSNLFNNHPALMVGTLALTEMNLDPLTLKIAYLASVIGSDIGSLLLPIGTLATLMWMHICEQGKVRISWKKYVKATLFAVPASLLFTLLCLYVWVTLMF